MAVVSGEPQVRGLMHESQAARRLRVARLDPTRNDVRFKPGDEVLLDNGDLLAAAVARQAVPALD